MPFISQGYAASFSREQYATLLANNLLLGYHPETGDGLFVPDSDRYAGTYVLGVQGSGKSRLLENMITHDMHTGKAVIVIDPHGDLTTSCIAALPPLRQSSTYLLDMEDEAYPFGVNVFSTGPLKTAIDYAMAVDRIMHIFEVLWPEVLSQQHLPRYVRAATMVLLANPGLTLVDMYSFLLDDQYRARLLNSPALDPGVKQFWDMQYNQLGDAERSRRVQPLTNRLEALFMGRTLVRNICGQRRTSIDFRESILNREGVFICLPIKTVAQDARLVGTFIMAQLQAAIFSFTDMREKDRPGVSLYIDEFQHFSTPDIDALFTEGRKFGLRLTVAHQYRSQLPSYLQPSTMTARTKICFQTTPEDGREMAHLFPSNERYVKPEDVSDHALDYLAAHNVDDPIVQTFIEMYLRPLQSQRRGHRVEIHDPGFSMVDTAFDMYMGGRGPNPRVDDPAHYLDPVLHEVMRTGNPNLPIPADAVVGFSNCGRSFFRPARALRDSNPLLQPNAKFPPYLVVPDGNGGTRWTRKPENANEQLFHFIYHLRMTMRYLAEHPIGKETTVSSTEVARMLAHLPRRAAFVRSAETVGVIYTLNTPTHLSGKELETRLSTIRFQTRRKYAHPKRDVEAALKVEPEAVVPPTDIKQRTISRWENV